jgi:hypothetical protein
LHSCWSDAALACGPGVSVLAQADNASAPIATIALIAVLML